MKKINEKNKKNLDVVLIATLRPDILNITLNTFYHNLLKNFNCRLIVNIDPIGDKNYTQEDIIKVCKKYFHFIVCNKPNKPSFTKAVFWCWGKVQTDIFFHLEDDWCLRSLVNKNLSLKPFLQENIVQVRLNIGQNKKLIKKDGSIHSEVFSLNPSFFRANYIKEKIKGFDFNLDPEKQIAYNIASRSFKKPDFVFYGIEGQNSMIIDIGKIFRELNAFDKWNSSGRGNIAWKRKKLNFFRVQFLKLKYDLYLNILKFKYCVES